MSNELTLFSEASIEASDSPKQITFNWNETFAETKELVKEDAELTATIDDAMVKRFHGRVKIGFNLMALQKEHSRKGGGKGDFTTTVLPELGITDRTFAHRCISVAKLFQNANVANGQHSDLFDLPMSIRTWENLASPSGQTVVKQLESGEIKPTQTAITKALEDAKNEAKSAREALAVAQSEKQRIQSQFNFYKEDAEQQKELLYAQIDELESRPEPEPQKITVYEDTPETKEKIAKLKEVESRLKQLEDELKDKSTLLQMKDSELDERTQQRDNLSNLAKELGKELDETRDANKARHEQEMYEYRINDRVQREAFGRTGVQETG